MTNQQPPDRPRIHSIMTRTRFLHLEDALTPAAEGKPGKIRFFIGAYQRGSGEKAVTAYHFLDDSAARVAFLDMSWGRELDIKDFKGSTNGTNPVSRVLTIRGPKDGKYWVQVANGPGEVIGAGAVKPAGKPTAEISIPLDISQARALALAVIEYMTAFRVTALFGPATIMYSGTVDTDTGEIQEPAQDAEDLFGPEQSANRCEVCGQQLPHHAPSCHLKPKAQAEPKKTTEDPGEIEPPTFFALANDAIKAGFDLSQLQDIIKSQIPWREKHITLQAAMSA